MTMTVDTDVATKLQELGYGTLGTNLFTGPEDSVNASIPDTATFVFAYGGPAPVGTFSGPIYEQHVQVIRRGAVHDPTTPRATARDIVAALNRAVITNYISCLALQSEPIPLGMNAKGCHRYVVNFKLTRQP